MTTSTYQSDCRQKKVTTILPINMNTGTLENAYNNINIYQIREEKDIYTKKLGLLYEITISQKKKKELW